MSLFPRSQLDPGQIIKDAYDETNQEFRVSAVVSAIIPGPVEVAIDQTTDSIAIGDGTTTFSGTTVGPDHGLDVNIIGGSVSSTVTGTVNTNLNGLNAFSTTQYVIGVTPTHIVIPAGASSVSVKALCTTTSDAVIIGNSVSVNNTINGTGNGYFLFYGDAVQIDVTNSASLYAVGTAAGQIICVLFAGA